MPPPVQPAPSAPPRRSVVAPLALALMLVVGGSAYLYWQQADQAPPPAAPSPDTGGYLDAPPGPRGPDVLGPLLTPGAPAPSTSDLLLSRPGDQPLASEPAKLAPYPGAKRLAGVARRGGAGDEQMSFWSIPQASVGAVVAYYRQQAADHGFTIALRSPGRRLRGPRGPATHPWGQRPVSRMYLRPGPDGRPRIDQVLTVYVTPDSATGVRVVIWLRQPAVAPGPAAEPRP